MGGADIPVCPKHGTSRQLLHQNSRQLSGVVEMLAQFARQSTIVALNASVEACQEHTRDTCIVVVEVAIERSRLTMGLIVDTVCEVLDFADEQIEPVPSFAKRAMEMCSRRGWP